MFVGIDLGTTFSAISHVNSNGQSEIIPSPDGDKILASVVLFDNGQISVGKKAKQESADSPYSVCQFIKRQMGERDFSFYVSDTEQYTPEEISAIILRTLKINAEKVMNERIDGAVITVPAYFNDAQRNATKDAGEIAGLNVLGIINEPTAAALAYCHNNADSDGNVLVYDLGGGTFDVTVLRLADNLKKIEVLSSDGMNNLGGFDFDNAIMNDAIAYFNKKYRVDLYDDDETMQELRLASEKAKIALSESDSALIQLPVKGKTRDYEITRKRFEELIHENVQFTKMSMEVALSDAGLKWTDIRKILLVGGSTRIPAVRNMIRETTGIEPSTELNPDEAVSLGAAYYADNLSKGEQGNYGYNIVKFSDVLSHSIGVAQVDSKTNEDISTVALNKNDVLPTNNTIPAYTLSEGQSKFNIRICQGEERIFKDNTLLGKSTIQFPPKRKGYKFDVSLECDINGIITVSLIDPNFSELIGRFSIDRVNNLTHKEIVDKAGIIQSKIKGIYADTHVSDSKVTPTQPTISNNKQVEENPITIPKTDPMEKINSLIGLNSVKQELTRIKHKLDFDQERARRMNIPVDAGNGHHFIFYGNPGTGKTTVARLVGEILYEYGIIKRPEVVEVSRSDLVGEFIGQTAVKTRDVIKKAIGGVLFVDEAYTLYKKDSDNDFGTEALEELLKSMEDHRNEFVVILAGYKKEMEELLDANPGIASRITDYIDFPDYTEDELLEIAHKIAKEKYFSISDDGEKAFLRLINKRKVNEKFGNARDVRTVIEKAIENKALIYATEAGEVNRIDTLSSKDFGVDLSEDASKGATFYFDELNKLTGLADVKTEFKSIIARVNYIKQEINSGNMSESDLKMNMNLCFMGNPGTGKTTVARIYSQLLGSVGILKKGHMIEASRNDLVAGYSGQTASKTLEICKKAYGGVLFIDEAYSIVRDPRDTFGQEALDTLIKEMEDNRDKLVVILAGYTKEMNEFFDFNSGIRSRIGKIINFPDYSEDELFHIFKGICNSHSMKLSAEAETSAKATIGEIFAKRDNNFGNAREMRNLYNIVSEKLMIRVMDEDIIDDEARHTIMPTDFA